MLKLDKIYVTSFNLLPKESQICLAFFWGGRFVCVGLDSCP